jgi:hypothetical protein
MQGMRPALLLTALLFAGCAPASSLPDAGSSLDAGASADAGSDAGCPTNFCACTCSDGDAGYRPQCGYVPGQGCVASDPCISGLQPDGGWAVCGL